MIAYKVVSKKYRYGSNWTMGVEELLYENYGHYIMKDIRGIMSGFPGMFPKYEKGATVKAAKGSIGILCFERKKDAHRFLNAYWRLREYATIIKVKGRGKRKGKVHIKTGAGGFFNYAQKMIMKSWKEPWDFCGTAPEGTVAFDEVEVLE